MVEFISEHSEDLENLPPEPEEAEVKAVEESLELLVDAYSEELKEPQPEKDYVDEPSSPGEYQQQKDFSFDNAPLLKDAAKPLVYDEKDIPVVVDIFERYGKSQPEDDKWWKKNSL